MAKRLLSLSISTALVGLFAVAACVGDDSPAAAPGTVAQGQLGGPCFANGTCNAGLSCNVVEGTAKCTTSSGSSSSGAPSADASPDGSSSNPTSDAGSDPRACDFQTTSFPCKDQQPPYACYGDTQSCTLTGCNSADLRWECNSARQCGTACCVPNDVATLTAGEGCTEGTLLIAGGAASGAACLTSNTMCDATATQLCQANSDCPAGKRCVPVRIIGAPASLNGAIVAACVP